VLYGFIKDKSSHLKALKDKHPNIILGKKPLFLKFSFEFDEVEDHQYADVYGIFLNN
jgi:hypothetical protein